MSRFPRSYSIQLATGTPTGLTSDRPIGKRRRTGSPSKTLAKKNNKDELRMTTFIAEVNSFLR